MIVRICESCKQLALLLKCAFKGFLLLVNTLSTGYPSPLIWLCWHVFLDVKVAAPNTALRVLDNAIQVHGAGGVSSDFPLSHLWASARTLRIADGPDEVHLGTIAKLELQRVSKL